MNIIDTDLGQIVCKPLSLCHVHIDGELLIGVTTYRVHATLELSDDAWRLQHASSLMVDPMCGNKEVTSAVRRQVIDTIEQTWSAFITANPDVGVKAERDRLMTEIKRLYEFIDQGEKAIEGYRRNITNCTNKLAQL